MVYVFTEKQNLQSVRKGEKLFATSMQSAKSKATRRHAFQGTVLTLETEAGELLAYKENGKWHDNCFVK